MDELHGARSRQREFEGRIERINPAAGAGTRSISVYAVIENPQGVLRGGMFARGALRLGQVEGALAIPVSAVMMSFSSSQTRMFFT